MGKRNRVTTRDIAGEAGVSQSTVSMILSNNPKVSFSAETVKLVEDTAKKLGYRPPEKKERRKEISLKDTIFILCPILANEYYSSIIHSITDHARSYGYHVLTAATLRRPANEEMYFEQWKKMDLAGLIVLYPTSSIAELNRLSRQFPVVSIGAIPEGIRYDSVELDNRKMGYVMGEYLLSLGHSHIDYLSGPINKNDISRSDRIEGMRRSFSDQGIDPERIRLIVPRPSVYRDYSPDTAEYQNGYDLTRQALEERTGCSAFVGHNDTTAYGIMGALADLGYRIPGDYSVCGFDNMSMSAMPQISLTTIEHATMAKGREAVDIIYRRNQNKNRDKSHSYVMRMEYEPELIIRGSSGRFHA